ncbi:class I SAM-dependent methyltransferase [Maribacter sp. 4G9]|uniref:class I SAM-dependent methyltransferase n=1 Tax=Maribacter sp. 4G9 TaxID=1889777 RepID=UPI000C1596A1|nr:class I SAM-dependent methyltransferase [Maribacter sp. 4G9]PIB39445.1 SAM-dependent methyltransferase [Maribacter sp. 4G9]
MATKKPKKPWPTKAAMEQIYEQHLWGGDHHMFYSGEGSHDPNLVKPYATVVSRFLKSFETPLTVCDLGCGDFNVGKQLAPYTKKYIGVDIVENLIDHHQNTFASDNIRFQCLDIAQDELPQADCAILRQVLQHVSNTEVQHIAQKLSTYKHIIVTEHLPEGDFVPNLDIISGQGIRLKKQSGVDLLAPPFNLKIIEKNVWLRQPVGIDKGTIVTVHYVLR